MTEVDQTKNIQAIGSQPGRSVLGRLITNFSGGMSQNTMKDSGRTAMAQASAQMDSTVVHRVLRDGGQSTTNRAGVILSMVSIEDSLNVVHSSPDQVVHVAEVVGQVDERFMEEALKPAVMNPEDLTGNPSRVFVVNVFSMAAEPSPDIEKLLN